MGDCYIIGRPSALATDWDALRDAHKIHKVDDFEDFHIVPEDEGTPPDPEEPVFVRD